MTGGQPKASTASCFWRRKFLILCCFIVLTVLFFVIREKYFFRADILRAVSVSTSSTDPPIGDDARKRISMEVQVKSKLPEGSTSIWSFFGIGGDGDSGDNFSKGTVGKKTAEKIKMNPWDEWMLRHKEMTSIGDIYNKCDNKTRRKIGKVVLQQKKEEDGVEIKSYLNQTYDYEIVTSHAHMEVYYNDNLLYEKDKDMCEAAKNLDTPYTCPIKAGHTIVIADVAKLPSYIPKGKYHVFSTITDQNNNEIGCTYIEFKTGNEDA